MSRIARAGTRSPRNPRRSSICNFFSLTALVALLSLTPLVSMAQQLTGSISGTTYDQSGATVPNAEVALKNEASNDTRTTTSNDQGFFRFSAVPPGTYTLTVTANGFQSWSLTGIAMSQGDNRTIPSINLKVGNTSSTVQVESASESVAPVDTGDVSMTLNNHMVNNLALTGRNVGELIKIMPGMANATGSSTQTGFSDRVVGNNSGPAGQFSANGQQPNGSMAYMLDGADLLDPGNMGTQVANINQDMTSEVKVLMSGYDAAYAKGPVVFEAYSKSGGATFHGEGYFYARSSIFNSNDAYFNTQGQKKPSDHEYYPGGNIGGPVLIPGTNFNKNRDKLFFWFGYEYMDQVPAPQLWQYFVPTQAMRNGDFSAATLNALTQQGVNSSAITTVPCVTGTQNGCKGLTFNNGQIPVSMMDPNSLALLKTYPMPNQDPTTHQGYNYSYLAPTNQNRWEQTEKIDYSISDNTKLSVSYGHQVESDLHPVEFWWAPQWSLPEPGGGNIANVKSDLVMANLTHVFNATLTNETVFTYARFINPLTQANPTAQNPATYGFNVPGLFGLKRQELPSIISWGSNNYFAGYYNGQSIFGGAWQGGKAFGGIKSMPAIYDNLSKVHDTHTMKFGVYWDSTGNSQSSGSDYNGTYEFDTWGATSTGNSYADFLLGRAQSYSQANAGPFNQLKFHQYSAYAQDSWKVSKRLTLNYGIRFEHIGQWYGPKSGIAVWDLANYLKDPSAPNAGLLWHAIDPKIPLSGFKSPLFYYLPRGGFAFDIFGTGRTVLRGGFAIYHYQLGEGSVDSASTIPQNIFSATSLNGLTSLAQITDPSAVPIPAGAQINGAGTYNSMSPLQEGDGKTPYTENYNFSIDQSFWHSVLELSYVGNRSRDLVLEGSNSDPLNPNMIPLGAFYRPGSGFNPLTTPVPNSGNGFRPLQQYGDIWLVGHGSYSNYNSLQATWQKQTGPLTAVINYTFGKVLGIWDNVSGNGANAGAAVDVFNLKNNYGPLSFDHTHIFNAAYVYNLPSPIKKNLFAKGVVNGWTLSGVTQWQSGAPLQPNFNGNMNTAYGEVPSGATDPSTGLPIYYTPSATTYLGTNQKGENLLPVVTCDPRKGLQSGQYFNPGCFSVPAFGTQGTMAWPYIHLPSFFNSDLALFKTFKITERQSVQFRVSANNFLNHPLPQFGLGGNSDVSLTFQTPGTTNGVHLLTPTNQNPLTTGKPLYEQGSRVVEFALKYYF